MAVRFSSLSPATDDSAPIAGKRGRRIAQDEPNEGRAAFSLPVEPWALEALGRLFETLHGDPSGEFYWSPDRGRVVPLDSTAV